MTETRRSWCSVCRQRIWFQRVPGWWRHDGAADHIAQPSSADVVADVADERVKERLFDHPTRRRRDPVGAYYESIGAEEVAQLDKRVRAVREMDR